MYGIHSIIKSCGRMKQCYCMWWSLLNTHSIWHVPVFASWVVLVTVTHLLFCLLSNSVLSWCDRCWHLPHPAGDRPLHCRHSDLLQAQAGSSEKWKRRNAAPGCVECVVYHAHTHTHTHMGGCVGCCGTSELDCGL